MKSFILRTLSIVSIAGSLSISSFADSYQCYFNRGNDASFLGSQVIWLNVSDDLKSGEIITAEGNSKFTMGKSFYYVAPWRSFEEGESFFGRTTRENTLLKMTAVDKYEIKIRKQTQVITLAKGLEQAKETFLSDDETCYRKDFDELFSSFMDSFEPKFAKTGDKVILITSTIDLMSNYFGQNRLQPTGDPRAPYSEFRVYSRTAEKVSVSKTMTLPEILTGLRSGKMTIVSRTDERFDLTKIQSAVCVDKYHNYNVKFNGTKLSKTTSDTDPNMIDSMNVNIVDDGGVQKLSLGNNKLYDVYKINSEYFAFNKMLCHVEK